MLLTDKEYLLEKFPGKGGWTYAAIPEVKNHPTTPFGWRVVYGSIDGFEIKNYHLMPMGNGHLFLPVKAEIRKIIRKNVGDTVNVILHSDDIPILQTDEWTEAIKIEPKAWNNYRKLSDARQKELNLWIEDSPTDDEKVKRISILIDQLLITK